MERGPLRIRSLLLAAQTILRNCPLARPRRRWNGRLTSSHITTLLKTISTWPTIFNMADHFQHGRPFSTWPITPTTPNTLFFPSRLSTTFPAYFFTITYHSLYRLGHIHHGKPTSTRPRHRWIPPLEKTYNCSNLGFRLPFVGIYAGWWTQGALLLLRAV